MKPRWLGLYKIHKALKKGLYKLFNPKTGKILKNANNQCRLTVYNTTESAGPPHSPQDTDSAGPSHSHSPQDTESAGFSLQDSKDLELLLFDNHLFRLWRTGAFEEVYTSEEDGHIDVVHVRHYKFICQ